MKKKVFFRWKQFLGWIHMSKWDLGFQSSQKRFSKMLELKKGFFSASFWREKEVENMLPPKLRIANLQLTQFFIANP